MGHASSIAPAPRYAERREWIREYFDRTAVDAWARLTSDAPVGRIRASVRAGRDRMRALLLARLPDDCTGLRVLDAGCGAGQIAMALARRGATVTAVDLSPTLVALAQERASHEPGAERLTFLAGDMLNPSLGRFDYVVAMDSLIHYGLPDAVAALGALAPRVSRAMLTTFAPRTRALAAMHALGRWFPRRSRSPSIEPVVEAELRARLAATPALAGWTADPTEGATSGFYKSRLIELRRTEAHP